MIWTPEKRRGAVGWGSSLYSFRITPDLGDNYTAYCLSHGNQTITFISLSTSCIQLPRWLKPLLPLVTNSAPNLHHECWILFAGYILYHAVLVCSWLFTNWTPVSLMIWLIFSLSSWFIFFSSAIEGELSVSNMAEICTKIQANATFFNLISY